MADCKKLNNTCTGSIGPDYNLDRDGNIKKPPRSPAGCIISPTGKPTLPKPNDYRCKDFQLENDRSNDFVESVVNESLNIGGATLNIYKLLGVHEQGKLIDCTGQGNPISNGDLPNFPAENAFDKYITEWRSIQRGEAVLASAYIGYDFGNIKLPNRDREAYGIDTNIYKNINAIAIKQSSNERRRATRVRIERSNDGIKWFGADIVLLPDDDCLNYVFFKSTVPSRYWRVRPLDFNGSETNDVWAVSALMLFHNYEATDEYNIQDKILLENRNRDYSEEPIPIKGFYDITDNITEFSMFGLEVPSLTMYINVAFNSCVAALGRPIVIGDIIEVPSEAQYSAKMKKILKWVEVTDVSWAVDGYTPGWKPTMLRIIAQPAMVSEETQDIFGDLAKSEPDESGLVSGEDGNSQIYQDWFDVSETIDNTAKDMVPELGADGSNTIRKWEEDEIDEAVSKGVSIGKFGLNNTGLYVEDAMPPNGAPYTEGDEFPDNPKHGDYHRIIYSGMAKDIPARLYRYSSSKGRWIYLETDKRALYNENKKTISEFVSSPTSKAENELTKYRQTLDEDCEE